MLARSDYLRDSSAEFERTCYVVAPFGERRADDGTRIDFDLMYRELVVPAIQEVGLRAVRADVTLLSGVMPDELLAYLDLSRLVIADITLPDANVFYELGRRHRARESGAVLIARKDGIAPFDLATHLVVRYSTDSTASVYESRARITAVLQQTLAKSG